jgi:exopolyphosphatase/guanosine-5'-triphosphate,3'-diphosphate pyrophosphatase
MWPLADKTPLSTRQAAVIDVGSNSVRLVIYRIEGRALWTVFNEKVVAGLGKALPATGRLSPEGVEAAMAAIKRFRMLLDGWKPNQIVVAATAAVREASDGPEFAARIKAETGFPVRVLSGEEEARYAALGVLAGDAQAKGVVGDLGGSSLELVRLNGIGPTDGATLPLGPLALGAPKPLDAKATRAAIEGHLAPLAKRFSAAEFHAVGGAWRNLSLIHMQLADYPLHVAHQYEISRHDALELTRFAGRLSGDSLQRMQGLSKKRSETLPYAALVLEHLIEALGIQTVTISAYGVREGLLLEAMPEHIRDRDPLIEGCEALTAHRGVPRELGPALEAWLAQTFSALPPVFGARERVLVAAACRLSDIGARLHPDHRADLAFEQVLRAPIAGMNHAERAFLACAAFSRYTAATTLPEASMVSRLLSPERKQRARALGSAVRLGCDVSGRNPRLLGHSRLATQGGLLRLSAEAGWQDMLLGEQIARRAETVSQALKLKLVLGHGA